MFGLGVVKGLGVTLKHFIETYVDDLKYVYFPKSPLSPEAYARRQGPEGRGIFTVEYPEVKLQIPENFRFIPFLVTDYEVPKDSPEFDPQKWRELNRCTSCGICAKVCPPQCIWIVRTDDPKTGKPIPQPAEFYIDTDICMNCGYCAEFCPFDAIKMDHDFELADYDREEAHIHDLERLLKPVNYYASIRPTWNAKEEAARRAEEEEKQRKAAEKAAAAAAKAEAAAQAQAQPTPVAESSVPADGAPQSVPGDKPKRSPEEIKAMREAMMAKKQERQQQEGGAPAASAEAAAADQLGITEPQPAVEAKPKKSPEEVRAQREAMLAKRQQRQTGESVPDGAETAPPVEAAPPTPMAETATAPPDDLALIEGIGPKIASLLQSAGITTFAQLAETEVSRLEQILDQAHLSFADPKTWPAQAKLAAAGDWEALKTLQDHLKAGREVPSA